jgi:hypothetical protein
MKLFGELVGQFWKKKRIILIISQTRLQMNRKRQESHRLYHSTETDRIQR